MTKDVREYSLYPILDAYQLFVSTPISESSGKVYFATSNSPHPYYLAKV
jgi:hypothetical protein